MQQSKIRIGNRAGAVSRNTVSISYAREDAAAAKRLYVDLRKQDVNAWSDTKNLLPGQDWQGEIRAVIL
ncbi:MAG: TIR domain-containing protein [Leptolyngbya sp. SIO1D8]|nr:TIR domain-containing protein [Leptolyngbya sp. SIO1D8]